MKVAIAGAGNVGFYLTEKLIQDGRDVIVIDSCEEQLEKLASHFDIKGVHGSGSSLTTLKEAEVCSADIFIAATSTDEANLIACLLAKHLNPEAQRLARIRGMVTDEDNLPPIVRSSVNFFVDPDEEAVKALKKIIEFPGAVDVMRFTDLGLIVLGINIKQKSPVSEKTLQDWSHALKEKNSLVVSIVRNGDLFIPRGNDVFTLGDTVYVACLPGEENTVLHQFGFGSEKNQKIMIWGYSRVAQELGAQLVADGYHVKMVERSEQGCDILAETIYGALVLKGDATDQAFLREEAIEDQDLFISATADDEENILSAILAKRLGARRGGCIIEKSAYHNLVTAMGLDIIVTPRVAMASSIMKFIREGLVRETLTTRDDAAEIVSADVSEDSPLTRTPIKDLTLPSGVIATAIVQNGKIEIPNGDSQIHPGDRVVFFASRESVAKLEQLFNEY